MDQLKQFLASAPQDWKEDELVRTFTLENNELITCVLWNNIFHISGTDIVKILVYRFGKFGRPVVNQKKFEEGIFSDLRNLKPGIDATLEEPRSELLDILYKHNCVRTQKKQKVFYWFSVPHDRLFIDALERDLKREAMGIPGTTSCPTPMSLNDALELSKVHCEPVTGSFMTDRAEMLPKHLNHLSSWMNGPVQLPIIPMDMSSPRQKKSTRKIFPYPGANATTLDASSSPMFNFLNQSSTPLLSSMSPNFAGFSPLTGAEGQDAQWSQQSAVSEVYDMFNLFDNSNSAASAGGLPSSSLKDEMKYSCAHPACGKKFKRIEHLRRHIRSHTESHNLHKFAASLPGSPMVGSMSSPMIANMESMLTPFMSSLSLPMTFDNTLAYSPSSNPTGLGLTLSDFTDLNGLSNDQFTTGNATTADVLSHFSMPDASQFGLSSDVIDNALVTGLPQGDAGGIIEKDMKMADESLSWML